MILLVNEQFLAHLVTVSFVSLSSSSLLALYSFVKKLEHQIFFSVLPMNSLRVLAGGILNFSGTLLGELIFLAQGDVLGILVHFWGS